MAPMSSTTATASRNAASWMGTWRLTRLRAPTANAMSVAIGMPQPGPRSRRRCDRQEDPGRHDHAPDGRDHRQQGHLALGELADVSSRLISMPTTKKKTAIRPSMITCRRSIDGLQSPIVNPIVVLQTSLVCSGRPPWLPDEAPPQRRRPARSGPRSPVCEGLVERLQDPAPRGRRGHDGGWDVVPGSVDIVTPRRIAAWFVDGLRRSDSAHRPPAPRSAGRVPAHEKRRSRAIDQEARDTDAAHRSIRHAGRRSGASGRRPRGRARPRRGPGRRRRRARRAPRPDHGSVASGAADRADLRRPAGRRGAGSVAGGREPQPLLRGRTGRPAGLPGRATTAGTTSRAPPAATSSASSSRPASSATWPSAAWTGGSCR